MHLEVIYSMMWLIKPKNITIISIMQISIWESVPKDSVLLDEKHRTIFTDTLQGPQVLGWAACKCPLHCPGPSLLRAISRLSLQWPGR
jgi:hypothetical protein